MSPMRYLLCLIGATAVANGSTNSYHRITRGLPNIPCTGDDDNSRHGYDDYDEPYGSQNQYSNDYYGDSRDDMYDDRGYDDRSPARGRGSPLSSIPMPNIVKNGDRRIGLALLGLGGVLTVLGMSLFFNKTLMRLGNLLFIAGVPMTIGPGRTAGYFFQPKKARATGCLVAGIFLVFIGWPVIGILLEAFGMLNLFGNMFPLLLAILKTMPVIGPILNKTSGSGGGGSRRGRNRYDDDDRSDYYDDRKYYDDRDPEDYY